MENVVNGDSDSQWGESEEIRDKQLGSWLVVVVGAGSLAQVEF